MLLFTVILGKRTSLWSIWEKSMWLEPWSGERYVKMAPVRISYSTFQNTTNRKSREAQRTESYLKTGII